MRCLKKRWCPDRVSQATVAPEDNRSPSCQNEARCNLRKDENDVWKEPISQDESTSCSRPQLSREGGQSNIRIDLYGPGWAAPGHREEAKATGRVGEGLRATACLAPLEPSTGHSRGSLGSCSHSASYGIGWDKKGGSFVGMGCPSSWWWCWLHKSIYGGKVHETTHTHTLTSACKTGENWIGSVV